VEPAPTRRDSRAPHADYYRTARSETEVKITPANPGREPATPVNDQDEWSALKLQDFIVMINSIMALQNTERLARGTTAENLRAEIGTLDNEIRTLEPAVQIVMAAVDPGLPSYTSPEDEEE
jgi:hypothetical protein